MDHKRYIDERDNPHFAAEMARLFDAGRVPPFAMVFPETQDRPLTDRGKVGRQLLQFGFVLSDGRGRVLPYARTRFVPDEADAGHAVTVGRSVLVGWSPVSALNGRPFPQSETDVRDAMHREVPRLATEPPPVVTFLGLARRTVALRHGGTARYYFYLFECRYAGPGPVGRRLEKDADDVLGDAFVPVDDDLLDSLGDRNKVDLRALEALTGRDFSTRGSGEVELVRPAAGDPPPFLVRSPGVFCCHSSVDKPFVLALRDRLEAIGIPTWVDHDRLRAGDVWFERAFEAVRYCQVFLLVASSHAATSVPCRDELAQAVERQRWLREHGSTVPYEIVPVVLDGPDPRTHLPAAVGNAHVIDCRDPAARAAAVDALVERIKAIVPPAAPPAG